MELVEVNDGQVVRGGVSVTLNDQIMTDLEVVRSNPVQVELGVCCTSVLS